jgi:hypothetical protein
MLLTITYTGQDTTDLGYLLYKNPYRPQVFELNHGKAYARRLLIPDSFIFSRIKSRSFSVTRKVIAWFRSRFFCIY